jgi:hypothetical protein
MPVGEAKTYQAVRSFLERQGLEVSEAEEQYCTKVTVRSGANVAHVSVFNTGKMVVGGKGSPVKDLLEKMKAGIEAGTALPGQMLPFEIDKFPTTIQERVPDCDPVIIRFVAEAIKCLQADALLGAAFLLGAASEKAISILIQSYVDGITNETNHSKLVSRLAQRVISKKWEEFLASFKGCQNKPADLVLSQDMDVILGNIFQFCRITRNEVGHPQIVPDLDRGVLLANFGQFVKYIERVYGLVAHFKQNGVVV